jgi:hypothetical protein
MWKRLAATLCACTFSLPLLAQKGTAPNGYYPASYAGATFTGVLQASSSNLQAITLIHTKGNKSETFVGKFSAPCTWKVQDGAVRTLDPSKARDGTILTAFYTSDTKKSGDRKFTENTVIAISFVEVGGRSLPDNEKAIIPCTTERFSRFVAF